MNVRGDTRTLKDVLDDLRRRRLVGRDEQVRAFRDALQRGRGSVLFVHGPGGIGKTTLLPVPRARAAGL